ncbi:uncharacterized protein LY89DRAFT_737196 [Mollisia scopiformis]|uniref:Uncharacterized protein n=1 Tax=Mollisia scopiformis TaxID=149040 RepID=A0A194WZT4_MOLSC|nr:uncharacterized protein LY89DRAFT_737196 [Mollisia scopiformis]KUJ13219.1 hypothetical protein LY89DRAFT_737196 [Mollisia scopiformis]
MPSAGGLNVRSGLSHQLTRPFLGSENVAYTDVELISIERQRRGCDSLKERFAASSKLGGFEDVSMNKFENEATDHELRARVVVHPEIAVFGRQLCEEKVEAWFKLMQSGDHIFYCNDNTFCTNVEVFFTDSPSEPIVFPWPWSMDITQMASVSVIMVQFTAQLVRHINNGGEHSTLWVSRQSLKDFIPFGVVKTLGYLVDEMLINLNYNYFEVFVNKSKEYPWTEFAFPGSFLSGSREEIDVEQLAPSVAYHVEKDNSTQDLCYTYARFSTEFRSRITPSKSRQILHLKAIWELRQDEPR